MSSGRARGGALARRLVASRHTARRSRGPCRRGVAPNRGAPSHARRAVADPPRLRPRRGAVTAGRERAARFVACRQRRSARRWPRLERNRSVAGRVPNRAGQRTVVRGGPRRAHGPPLTATRAPRAGHRAERGPRVGAGSSTVFTSGVSRARSASRSSPKSRPRWRARSASRASASATSTAATGRCPPITSARRSAPRVYAPYAATAATSRARCSTTSRNASIAPSISRCIGRDWRTESRTRARATISSPREG